LSAAVAFGKSGRALFSLPTADAVFYSHFFFNGSIETGQQFTTKKNCAYGRGMIAVRSEGKFTPF
jgi:hypothetical protein